MANVKFLTDDFYLTVLIYLQSMMDVQPVSGYLQLYQYLQVLSEDQIIKLRKIAVGILQLSAFSKEEIEILDNKIRKEVNTTAIA